MPLPSSSKENISKWIGKEVFSSKLAKLKWFVTQYRERRGSCFYYLSINSQDKFHTVAFVHLFQGGHKNIRPPVTFPHQRPAQGTMGFQPTTNTNQ